MQAIEDCPRTEMLGPWFQDEKHRWALHFSARLSVEPTEFMPAESGWYLVVGNDLPHPAITIYPAVEGGIECTFPHQSANLIGATNSLWRQGNPCLERPEATFKRDAMMGEPSDVSDRLVWRVGRLLGWIDAAAAGTLMQSGDYVELPTFDARSTPVLGFVENPADLFGWLSVTGNWGYAVTGLLQGTFSYRKVISFLSRSGDVLKTADKTTGQSGSAIDAIWMILPQAPILAPWQAPVTWQELSVLLADHAFDLGAILSEAGRSARAGQIDALPSRLMLGFPFAERVGQDPERLHWIAIEKIGLSNTKTKRDGFRPTEQNRASWDQQQAQSTERLHWIKTLNWASDQLRTRGEAEDVVRSSHVLILGAGAIGSAVAENLARSGVLEIGIMDADLVEMGNLSRHTLSIADCGHPKAKALATRLNDCMLDVTAEAYDTAFPPSDTAKADAIQTYDVIIDCTGSDTVLESMAKFEWKGEKLFASLSISWAAKEFYCFAASETMFPAADAKERFSKHVSFRPDMSQANREGIGCWHPVFPATADDIQQWSAIGTKFIRSAIRDRQRVCKIYRADADGGVSVTDA
jgi:hypothetical protein